MVYTSNTEGNVIKGYSKIIPLYIYKYIHRRMQNICMCVYACEKILLIHSY